MQKRNTLRSKSFLISRRSFLCVPLHAFPFYFIWIVANRRAERGGTIFPGNFPGADQIFPVSFEPTIPSFRRPTFQCTFQHILVKNKQTHGGGPVGCWLAWWGSQGVHKCQTKGRVFHIGWVLSFLGQKNSSPPPLYPLLSTPLSAVSRKLQRLIRVCCYFTCYVRNFRAESRPRPGVGKTLRTLNCTTRCSHVHIIYISMCSRTIRLIENVPLPFSDNYSGRSASVILIMRSRYAAIVINLPPHCVYNMCIHEYIYIPDIQLIDNKRFIIFDRVYTYNI